MNNRISFVRNDEKIAEHMISRQPPRIGEWVHFPGFSGKVKNVAYYYHHYGSLNYIEIELEGN